MFQQQRLFTSGDGGYLRYRIPALAVTSTGAILAFCEARKHTGRDSDQIDLLMRRSIDHGETFSEPVLLFSERDRVCGNPAGPGRRDLTLRLSYDECRSWALSRTLYQGSAQYSDLCVADDMTILCLYERGLEAPYQTLTLARLDLGWLEAGPHAK